MKNSTLLVVIVLAALITVAIVAVIDEHRIAQQNEEIVFLREALADARNSAEPVGDDFVLPGKYKVCHLNADGYLTAHFGGSQPARGKYVFILGQDLCGPLRVIATKRDLPPFFKKEGMGEDARFIPVEDDGSWPVRHDKK